MPQNHTEGSAGDASWLKRALVASGTGLWEWDHRRHVARLCQGAAGLLAGDRALAWQDLSLNEAFSQVHSEDFAQVRLQLSSAAYTDDMQSGQYRAYDADGTTRRVLLRGRTRLGNNGEAWLTMGTVIDVTTVDLEDDQWLGSYGGDPLDEAARHMIAAYNAIRLSDHPSLVTQSRALLFALGAAMAANP